jgi:hypothetical protein
MASAIFTRGQLMTKNPLKISVAVGLSMALLHSVLAVGSVVARAQFEVIFHLGMALVFTLLITFIMNEI